MDGNFKSARKVEKAESVTIIPVTEDSGTRSSGIAPHPLCDKLCYIAGDYTTYTNDKKTKEILENGTSILKEFYDIV